MFPNPVSVEAHIRFVLNRESNLILEVFDASGRKVYTEYRQNLAPAEHDISLSVDKWQQGLYLLRIGIGNRYVVKEMVIQ